MCAKISYIDKVFLCSDKKINVKVDKDFLDILKYHCLNMKMK